MRRNPLVRLIFISLLVSVASGLVHSAEKPLSKEAQNAIAKYDALPDVWREKAVAAWKSEFKDSDGAGKKALRKNDPPFYPDFFLSASEGNPFGVMTMDSWGRLNEGEFIVEQIIDDKTSICRRNSDVFKLFGVSTKGWVDGKTYKVAGAFFVDGNTRYATAIGGSKTVFVVKPIPLKGVAAK